MISMLKKERRGIAGPAIAAALCVALSGIWAGPAGASSAPARTAPATTGSDTAACPWLNQQLPVGTRVSELLSAMTLDQKLDLLGLANEAGYENVTTAVPQLCIPEFTLNDGPAGIIAGPADSHTQLPSPIGVAAAFDPALARQYGAVMGSEAAAKGIDVIQGPVLNIDRVPQDGRTFETLGEDPALTGQMGVDIENGIESQGVGAMPKHFALYNQEANRNTPADNVVVSDRVLHEIYLPAWQQTVDNGHPSSMMCSYSSPGGTYACQNPDLLDGVLRDQLGFTGFVRSDLDAVHDPVAGFNAGTDQLKPAQPQQLQQAVVDGQISAPRLNQAVSRILTQMFQLGAFDHQPAGNANSAASAPANVTFAKQAAEQSTVLLKNTGQTLPLGGQTGSIAMIGADAGSGALTASPAPSSTYVSSSSVVTPYQGVQQAAPAGTTVTYNDGSDLSQAAAAARAAKVAVVFASVPEIEGQDLTGISLPGNQDQLIEAVAAANPDTVVVLNSATPVLMPWLGQVKSVLDAWYPGQQDGNAIAGILFGAADPSGKLPITFPASADQTPVSTPAQYPGANGQVDYSEGLDVGYRWYDANNVTPLFPFGYGLSYTTFAFSHLSVSPAPAGPVTSLGTVHVDATVTNTGTTAGSDVAQLYLGDPPAAGEPPRQLKGFQKVSLAPGQSTRVHFTLTGADMSTYDSAAHASTVPDGTYQVQVGDSSAAADLPLHGSYQVTATTGTRHATITAPTQPQQAGKPFTVTASLTSGGDMTVNGAQLALTTPPGWQVTPAGPVTADTLGPSQPLTASWQVTAPPGGSDNISQLTATATYHGPGGTATSSSHAQVTIDPLVTTTLTPPALFTQPGQTSKVTMTSTNSSGYPITLNWAAAPPSGSGITTDPASGSATLTPGASSTTQLTVTTSPSGPSGTATVPLNVSATADGTTVPGAGGYLQVTTPYPSVAAAYGNTGITDDSNPAPGNFDGSGNSYSTQALAAVGLTQGGTVTAGGVTFTWPDVPAGQPDNVVASGQTIAVSGSGSKLGFLGTGVNGAFSGTGTVYYTDGTTQAFTIGFPNWTNGTPPAGDDLVAKTSYLNTQSGQRTAARYLYAAYVPLAAGKTAAAVQLPTAGSGNTGIHIFAIGTG